MVCLWWNALTQGASFVEYLLHTPILSYKHPELRLVTKNYGTLSIMFCHQDLKSLSVLFGHQELILTIILGSISHALPRVCLLHHLQRGPLCRSDDNLFLHSDTSLGKNAPNHHSYFFVQEMPKGANELFLLELFMLSWTWKPTLTTWKDDVSQAAA